MAASIAGHCAINHGLDGSAQDERLFRNENGRHANRRAERRRQ